MPRGVTHTDSKMTDLDQASRDLIIVHPTPEQRETDTTNVLTCWSNALSFADALKRDQETYLYPYLSRYIALVLVPADQPTTRDLRCSAELYPVSLLVCPKGSSGPPQPRHAYLIDTVIVPPQHRGNGYASIMARKVYQWVLERKIGGVHYQPCALIGFSDCGSSIWEPAGRAYRAKECIWAVDDLLSDAEGGAEPARKLSIDDIVAMASTDAQLVAEKLARRPADRTRFCIRPTPEMYEAGLRRAETTLRLRGGDRAVPQTWGAQIADDCYAYWFHSYDEEAIIVTRFEAPNAREAEKLLKFAAIEAAWWGWRRIIAWDIDDELLEWCDSTAGPEVTIVERTYNVPVAAWLDELDGEADGGPVWMGIERFAVVLES